MQNEEEIRKKKEISEFMREFNDIDLELDEEESKAFIKWLNEPNPKAKAFMERAKKRFEGVDMTADVIPIKIKLKKK